MTTPLPLLRQRYYRWAMLTPNDIKTRLGYGAISDIARQLDRSPTTVHRVMGYYDKKGQLIRRDEAPPYPVRREISRRLGLSMRQVFGP